jgi:hypothetical protein
MKFEEPEIDVELSEDDDETGAEEIAITIECRQIILEGCARGRETIL